MMMTDLMANNNIIGDAERIRQIRIYCGSKLIRIIRTELNAITTYAALIRELYSRFRPVGVATAT
jgi:hypothetical protein